MAKGNCVNYITILDYCKAYFRTKNILNVLALIVELAKRMKGVTIEPEYDSYKRDVINTVRDNIDKFTQILNDNNFNYSNKLINIQLDEIIHEYFLSEK